VPSNGPYTLNGSRFFPGSNVQLDGKVWTKEVLSLRKAIKYDLPTNQHDRLFDACHAEKQLVAFFVNCQALFPNAPFLELETTVEKICYGQLDDLAMVYPSAQEIYQTYKQWVPDESLVAKTYVPLKAQILVSRSVCNSCRNFVDRVNGSLGLEIKVRSVVVGLE
jgi:hypothetical protein